MKTKKIFSLTLICMMLVSIIFGSADVSAKAKKSLKVTYKGKTVTLVKDIINNAGRNKSITLAKCEKAWGKAKKKNTGTAYYDWKSKKTKISLTDFDAPAGAVGSIYISVKDKSSSIAGIKVGMSKAKAIKKLKKTFGSKNVSAYSKYIYLGSTIVYVSFEIKNGKVIAMKVERS